MTEHTPGPELKAEDGLVYERDGDGWVLAASCRAQAGYETDGGWQRLAQLFAAAPDMKAALEPFAWLAEVMDEEDVLTYRGVYITYRQAQAAKDALNKAKGNER